MDFRSALRLSAGVSARADHPNALPSGSGPECLGKVALDIADGLEPDGDADQPFADAGAFASLGADASVSRTRGVGDRRARVPEIGCERHQPDPIERGPGV